MVLLKNEKNKSLYDLKVTRKNQVKLEEIKEGKKVSIVSDSMFKAMFQNNNRLKYSAKFISYFIDVSYEEILKNIHLSKNELDKEKNNTKNERCDYVAIIDNTMLNIEVNNNSSEKTLERNIEYAYKLYNTKMKVGDKKYEYFQVIQFNINNFAFEGNEKIIDIYKIRNEEGVDLTKKIIIIQIYIPNLMKKWYTKSEQLEEREKYLVALVEQDIDKLNELGGEEIMNEYIEEAKKVSFEEGFGESYDKELAMKEMYIEEGITQGLSQGISQGITQGLSQGITQGLSQGITQRNMEIAKNMLLNNYSKEEISKIIGLSIEEINKLKENN